MPDPTTIRCYTCDCGEDVYQDDEQCVNCCALADPTRFRDEPVASVTAETVDAGARDGGGRQTFIQVSRENDAVVVRIPLNLLTETACYPHGFQVTDRDLFGSELVSQLERETQEDGTTLVNEMIDAALLAMAEGGAESIEEDPDA